MGETMKKWTYMKSIESCFGEENMKQYMVNMKKTVAKCTQQDAPELNLPPFRNTYRFINTMLTNADQMEENQMMKLFHVMGKMEKMREYSHHSSGPWDSDYDQSSYVEKMFKKSMMREFMDQMFDHSSSDYDSSYDYNYDHSSNTESSNFRNTMAALLSRRRNKRQANKGQAKGQGRKQGQGRKDNANTAPAPLDIGDKLVEKLKYQQEQMEQTIGNMTCVLRETGILNQQNKLDIRTQKQYFQQYNYSEHVNVGQVHMYMKCIKVHKIKTCMNNDIKEKIETNFGPLDKILEQTQLTEEQLFPLVMNLLHGDEMEFGF